MKRLSLVLLCLAFVLTLAAAATTLRCSAAPAATESGIEQVWTCSMHPQIRLAKPGQCPICGMNLVPAKPDQGQKPAAAPDQKKTEKPKIEIDEKKKTVTLPAVVAEQGKSKEELKGAIQYALVGKTGKVSESLFVTECAAEDLSAALLKVGAKAGKPAAGETPPEGTSINIFVEYTLEGKKPVRRPIDELVTYLGTGRPVKAQPWIFTGSTEVLDPVANAKVLQAKVTQNLIGLHWADASPLLQNPRKECLKQNIYGANTADLPPAGTAVKIVFEPQVPNVVEGTRRVHVFLTGRVQGVGYRDWTVRQANELGLKGWVRNLADGRVEAVAEGPKDKVAELLKRMETGPNSAKVDKVDPTDETPQGDFKDFTRR